MDRKLCSCPNDLPNRSLPPRPGRTSEPHFKIGGKTSPGRFSRHFYNLFPNSGKEDERSDSRNNSMPSFYITPQETLRLMRASHSGAVGPQRTTLSPVKEHPVLVITVICYYNTLLLKDCNKKSSNKLRMKALVGWNTLFQVQELINIIFFFTRIKNDIDKVDKIAWDLN